jgi:thiamine pyrophosphokinase
VRRAILIGPVINGSSRRDLKWLKLALGKLHRGSGDLVIGVDGGTELALRVGAVPDLCIGDGDSFISAASRKRALSRIRSVLLPRTKARSDLHFALRFAQSVGAREIVCFGVTGGRPDHHLASLLELSRVPGARALDPTAEYYFLVGKNRRLSLTLRKNSVVSVFSLDGAAQGVRLRGFEYRLSGARLEPSSHGLSNRVTGSRCVISVEKGKLGVVIPTQ